MARPPRRKRRLRGTGSVFLRPDGRWEGRWQAPQDGSGERLWIRRYGRSESEADSFLADAIRDHKRGAAIADTTTSVSDYLDGWLDRIAPSLKPSTYRAYKGAIRVWIIPRVGSIAVGSLTGLHVQRMVDTTASENGVRSAGIAHAVLRKAFGFARRAGPHRGSQRRPGRDTAQVAPQSTQALDDRRSDLILGLAAGHP